MRSMPDGFEQRQDVVFFLQPFNLNLTIGRVERAVFWGAEQGAALRNATAQGGAVPMGRAKSLGCFHALGKHPTFKMKALPPAAMVFRPWLSSCRPFPINHSRTKNP